MNETCSPPPVHVVSTTPLRVRGDVIDTWTCAVGVCFHISDLGPKMEVEKWAGFFDVDDNILVILYLRCLNCLSTNFYFDIGEK